MTALMQSITTLINQEIRKLTEKLHEEFPHTSSIKMLSILCELQQIGGLPEEETQKMVVEETLAKFEKGTLIQSISNLIIQKIWKFAEKVHEEFPEITVNELLSIWCEQQQICGFIFPDREKVLQDPNTKTCQHMFLKVQKANTQCKVKVKGDVEFCSRHKPKP
jgi:hypothetical protein